MAPGRLGLSDVLMCCVHGVDSAVIEIPGAVSAKALNKQQSIQVRYFWHPGLVPATLVEFRKLLYKSEEPSSSPKLCVSTSFVAHNALTSFCLREKMKSLGLRFPLSTPPPAALPPPAAYQQVFTSVSFEGHHVAVKYCNPGIQYSRLVYA